MIHILFKTVAALMTVFVSQGALAASWTCQTDSPGAQASAFLVENADQTIETLYFNDNDTALTLPCLPAKDVNAAAVEYECRDNLDRWGHSAKIIRSENPRLKKLHVFEHGNFTEEAIETIFTCGRNPSTHKADIAFNTSQKINVFVSEDSVTCEHACSAAQAKALSELAAKCTGNLFDVKADDGFCTHYDYTVGCSISASASCD